MRHPSKVKVRQAKRAAEQRKQAADAIGGIRASLAEVSDLARDLVVSLQAADPGRHTPFPSVLAFRAVDQPDIPYAELWARVKWTQTAADMIRADEYRYISPEWHFDYTDDATGDNVGAALLAIGLTNRPYFTGMAPIEDPDENNESDVQLFATGEYHHDWYGRFTIEPRHFDEMIANWPLVMGHVHAESPHPSTDMVVDYGHGSLSFGADEAKAAGWAVNDSLQVRNAEDAPARAASSPTGEKPTMNDARIREILGLTASDTVTEEHRNAALDELDSRLASAPQDEDGAEDDTATDEGEGDVEGAATEDGDGSEDTTEGDDLDVDSIGDDPSTLTASQLASLKAGAAAGMAAQTALRQRDARDKVAAAMRSGKLAAKSKEWAERYAFNDPTGFDEFVANAATVVDMGTDGDEGFAGDGVEAVRATVADLTGRQDNPLSLVAALKVARERHGAEAVEAYRRPNAA